MPQPRRPAFTLLELVLVMTIIVIFTALAYPSLATMYAQQRVTAGSDALSAALANARSQAMEEGIPYRVAVLPGKGNFRVAPDLQSFWGSSSDETAPSDSDNPPYISQDYMPNGVVFAEKSTPQTVEEDALTYLEPEKVSVGDYRLFAVYLPDGTARADQKVLICGRNAGPSWVHLRSLTGVVSVIRYKEGDN